MHGNLNKDTCFLIIKLFFFGKHSTFIATQAREKAIKAVFCIIIHLWSLTSMPVFSSACISKLLFKSIFLMQMHQAEYSGTELGSLLFAEVNL